MKKIALFGILALSLNCVWASDLTNAKNYYPGGKYSIGSRYARSNPTIEKVKNNIRLTSVTTYQNGPIQLEIKQYGGDLYYERRFENHPLSVHGSWGRAASKTVNTFKGNIINGRLGVTNATINGSEFHPEHAYDAKDGGDHPYDIYNYNVNGTVTITTIREVDKPKPLPTPPNSSEKNNQNNEKSDNKTEKTDNQERDISEKLYGQDDSSSKGEYDLSQSPNSENWKDLDNPPDLLAGNNYDPNDPSNLLACNLSNCTRTANGTLERSVADEVKDLGWKKAQDTAKNLGKNVSKSAKDAKKLNSNKAADDFAKSKGFKNAHDLKNEYIKHESPSRYNIYVNNKTGESFLINSNGKVIPIY